MSVDQSAAAKRGEAGGAREREREGRGGERIKRGKDAIAEIMRLKGRKGRPGEEEEEQEEETVWPTAGGWREGWRREKKSAG